RYVERRGGTVPATPRSISSSRDTGPALPGSSQLNSAVPPAAVRLARDAPSAAVVTGSKDKGDASIAEVPVVSVDGGVGPPRKSRSALRDAARSLALPIPTGGGGGRRPRGRRSRGAVPSKAARNWSTVAGR